MLFSSIKNKSKEEVFSKNYLSSVLVGTRDYIVLIITDEIKTTDCKQTGTQMTLTHELTYIKCKRMFAKWVASPTGNSSPSLMF